MENNIDNFFETGDYIIVFAGEYLGCGRTNITLESRWHEIRRDDFAPLQEKRLQALCCKAVLELKSSTQLWDYLNRLPAEVFISGGILQLFPMNCRRRGYQFNRVFFDSLTDSSGNTVKSGTVKLSLICETSTNAELFTRLPENSRPENLPEMCYPDLKNMLRQTGMLLAEKLGAVFDHTLHISYITPDKCGAYFLELKKCKTLDFSACRIFELQLTARFPWQEKFIVDEKLYKTANFLQDFVIEQNSNIALYCRVDELDFSKKCTVAGKTYTESIMHFSLTLI